MSSIKGSVQALMGSRISATHLTKLLPAHFKPNGSLRNSNTPLGQVNAVHFTDDSFIGNCQYPFFASKQLIYRISPSISREISDNFENANLGVRPILGSRKMSSLTTRQATNMLTNFLNNKSLPLLLLCMCSRNS